MSRHIALGVAGILNLLFGMLLVALAPLINTPPDERQFSVIGWILILIGTAATACGVGGCRR